VSAGSSDQHPGRLRIGTRRSALALRQTDMVMAMLLALQPDLICEVVHIATEGDERRDVPLAAIAGTGVFVKRIERALVAGEIDLAVHSLKDVPTEIEPGLCLAAIPPRADPRDVLIVGVRPADSGSPGGTSVAGLPAGARVGTSSQRRAVQLRALRSDLAIVDIRGNVDTRLRKLDDGEVDALILAAAGLDRLDRGDRIARRLDPDEMLPMVGQGALAIETRADDGRVRRLVAGLDHAASRLAVESERAFLAALGGGCTLPVGALAEVDGDAFRLRVLAASQDGGRIERRDERGSRQDAARIADRLAREILATVGALS
jgi:hydroxymethylbilane synthase